MQRAFRNMLGGTMLLGAVLLGGPAQAQVSILFNSYEPPALGNARVLALWARDIEKTTEGRVKLQIPPASLAPPNQQWQMVLQGVADGSYTFNAWLQNKLLLPRVADIPFTSNSAESAAVALWRTHEKYFAQANEHDEVVLLGYCAAAPDQFFSLTSKPVQTAADFKNLKVAVLPTTADRLRALGAVPVVGPAVQLHDKAANRIVDAVASISVSTALSVNIGPYIKSVMRFPSGAYIATFSYFVSRPKWAEISPSDQKLLRSVSGERLARHCGLWDQMDVDAYKKFEEAGTPITDAQPALVDAMKKAWAPLEKQWLDMAASRRVDGKAALAYYREQALAIEGEKKK